jgi:hypothetical protein
MRATPLGVQLSSYPEKNQEALNEFVTPLEIVPFDDRAANRLFFFRTV